PCRVSGEPHAALRLEPRSRLQQTEISFLQEIAYRQAVVPEADSHACHQPGIGSYELMQCGFVLVLPPPACEFLFPLAREQRRAHRGADELQVRTSAGRTVYVAHDASETLPERNEQPSCSFPRFHARGVRFGLRFRSVCDPTKPATALRGHQATCKTDSSFSWAVSSSIFSTAASSRESRSSAD